jgi:hypothetical protein
VSHEKCFKTRYKFFDVAKINLQVSMRMFQKKVSCCWALQTLNFNVADVEFRCCRLVMLGLCRGGGGRGLLMLDVARNTSRSVVAI